jgi:hypothetical protein
MRGTRLTLLSRRLLLVALAGCAGSWVEAAEQSVKPLGTFPFALPGSTPSPDGQPRAILWCRGNGLVGVLAPETKAVDCSAAGQKRSAPRAFLLRDGRCDAEGGALSFGFLAPRKAWVFEGTSRRTPQERTVWLLLRFEGAVKAGQLTGTLVQVDVSHPGLPFQRTKVEADALPSGDQASFADEAAWRAGLEQAFCLATGEP